MRNIQNALQTVSIMVGGKGCKINDKYRRVLEFMEKRGTVNNKEIQKHLKLKSTSVVNYLKEMLELELIEKIRDGRNISYKIKVSK